MKKYKKAMCIERWVLGILFLLTAHYSLLTAQSGNEVKNYPQGFSERALKALRAEISDSITANPGNGLPPDNITIKTVTDSLRADTSVVSTVKGVADTIKTLFAADSNEIKTKNIDIGRVCFLEKMSSENDTTDYLLNNEGFEQSGIPSGMFSSGTVDFDYNTQPIFENESAEINSNLGYILKGTSSALSGIHTFFLVRFNSVTTTGSRNFFALRLNSTIKANIYVHSTGVFYAAAGASSGYGQLSLVNNIDYAVWVDWESSSGSNDGVFKLYITPLNNNKAYKPDQADVNITNHNVTDDINRVYLYATAETMPVYYDNWTISSSEIKNFNTQNEYGGGVFISKSAAFCETVLNDSTPDGGIILNMSPGKRWVRQDFLISRNVDVVWYGALPDSSGNSTTAFINAGAAAGRLGADVIVPAGRYKVSSGIASGKWFLWGSQTWRGQRTKTSLNRSVADIYPWADGDTLVMTSKSASPPTGHGISGKRASLSNINLNGIAADGDTASIGIFVADESEQRFINVVIQNVTKGDSSIALYNSGANSCRFIDMYFSGNDIDVYENGSDGILYEGCRFNSETYLNVWLRAVEHISFTNCNWNGNGTTEKIGILGEFARAIKIDNCYVELGTNVNSYFIETRQYDTNIGSYNEFNLYNSNVKLGQTDAGPQYAYNIQSHKNLTKIRIEGGRTIVESATSDSIGIGNVKDTTTYLFDVVNHFFGKAGGNAEKPYTIYGYTNDVWRIVSDKYKPTIKYNYPLSIAANENAGWSELRASGAGRGSTTDPNLIRKLGSNLISKKFDGTSTGILSLLSGVDTVDIDVVTYTNYATDPFYWKARVSQSHSSGDYGEGLEITYSGLHDGVAVSTLIIDTLYQVELTNTTFDTVYIEAKTDSSFRCVIVDSDGTNNMTFTGETVYGNNIKSATMSRR